MTLNLREVKIGQSVADMHDGIPDFKELFNLKSCKVDRIQIPAESGHIFISDILTQKNKLKLYINKFLVLVNFDFGSWIFAYSYDARYFGLIKLYDVEF